MEDQKNKIGLTQRKLSKKPVIVVVSVLAVIVFLYIIFGIQNQKKSPETMPMTEQTELVSVETIKEENNKVKVFDVVIENKMSSEEMIFAIEEIVSKWKNIEISAEIALSELDTYANVKFEEVALIANEKIDLITLEIHADQSYTEAEEQYKQGLYVEALTSLKEIPEEYSKYSDTKNLISSCQKSVLGIVKDPYTVEEYEEDVTYITKCLALFENDELANRKKELEDELVILKDVQDIILTATQMYDGKSYEEAFAILALGLEQYPENERIEESLVNFHDHFIIQTTIEVSELCKAEAYNDALAVIDEALLEYDCEELQDLKVQVKEEKSFLYKFKNNLVEQVKFYAHEFTSEEFDVKQLANDAGTYVVKSGKTLLLGDYAEEEVTVLALTGNVAASLAGIDAFMDIRDLTYDLTHWGEEEYFVAHLAVDVIALIPVVGMIKYLDHYKVAEAGVDAVTDMVDSIADVGKNTEATAEAVDAMFTTAKTSYKVIDTADVVKDVAKTRPMAKIIKNNASKGYKCCKHAEL